MAERLSPRPIAPEVHITRNWIEDVIIKNGICPPLVRITQSEKDA